MRILPDLNIRSSLLIFFIFFTMAFTTTEIAAQPYFREDLVKVSGQLLNSETGEEIPYAHVINLRVHGGTITDGQGKFSLQADPSDTLSIKALGFKSHKLIVADFLALNKASIEVNLVPIRYLVDEIDVEGEMPKVNMTGIPQGKPSDIPIELRSDAYNEKPGILTALFSPLSFLHYSLNRKEKNKRKAISIISDDREWKIFSLVYNRDILERLTGYQDDELDDFMLYCNANHGLHYSASQYEVEKRVAELLTKYQIKASKTIE